MTTQTKWRPPNGLNFAIETLLYGLVFFLLFALLRWMLKAQSAISLFEIWGLSTIVLGPFVWAVRQIAIEAFKW